MFLRERSWNLTHLRGEIIQGGMLAVLNFRAPILFHTFLEVGDGMRNSRRFLYEKFHCDERVAVNCREVMLIDLYRYITDTLWKSNMARKINYVVTICSNIQCSSMMFHWNAHWVQGFPAMLSRSFPARPGCPLPTPFAMILVQTCWLGSYQNTVTLDGNTDPLVKRTRSSLWFTLATKKYTKALALDGIGCHCLVGLSINWLISTFVEPQISRFRLYTL